MFRGCLRVILWCGRHPWKFGGLCLFSGFIALNILAFAHAWSMTHFVDSGRPQPSPESLSLPEKAAILLTGVRVPKPQNRLPSLPDGEFDVCRFPTTDGLQIEAWHFPVQQPHGCCLLFHGYSAAKSSLLREALAFRELGFEVLLVDFRGSGGSQGNQTTLGYREADDVRAAVNYARDHLQSRRCVLYGRSMGGVAVLRALAVNGVQADLAIIECPFDRLLHTVGRRFHAMGLPAFPSAELLVFWGSVQNNIHGFSHNPLDYAEKIDCPTLILHGTADPQVSVAEVESVYARLRGPKRLHLFADLGHESYLKKAPAEWPAAIADFLQQNE